MGFPGIRGTGAHDEQTSPMSDATLPVWALILIPLASATAGAMSGPVTEKFRSASETRNRQADREAVAKAKNDEIQQTTIVQLLDAMNEVESCALDVLNATPLTSEALAARLGFGIALNKADSLRVRVADAESRELALTAIEAVQTASEPGDHSTLPARIETSTNALRTMTERLGVAYRASLPS